MTQSFAALNRMAPEKSPVSTTHAGMGAWFKRARSNDMQNERLRITLCAAYAQSSLLSALCVDAKHSEQQAGLTS